MPPSPAARFAYGHQGGSPPASFELLTIAAGGAARYVAANPWPIQPPFDEIGIYGWTVAAGLAEELSALAGPTRVANPPPPSYDSGSEFVEIRRDNDVVSVTWSPLAPDPRTVPLIAAVRKLISEGRRHPISTLRASLAPPDGERESIAVVLSAGGTESFELARSAQGSPALAIRLRLATGPAVPTSELPARIVGLDPSPIVAGPTAATIPAGSNLSIAAPFPEAAGEGDARLEALVQVRIPLVALRGEHYLQDGWLLPEPVAWPPQ